MKETSIGRIFVLFTTMLLLAPCPAFCAQTDGDAARETRVLLMGDSIMIQLARAIERELAGKPGYEVTSAPSLGTGLARLDLFDWHRRIEEMTGDGITDILVMMIGTNDKQPMRTDAKTILQPHDAAWSVEYARRVARSMDIMIENAVKHIIWIELPDMREKRLQQDALEINSIIEREADARPGVIFLPSKHLLSRAPGTYSHYVLQDDGMPLRVRSDGVHLNRAGADLLGSYIVSHITSILNGSKTP